MQAALVRIEGTENTWCKAVAARFPRLEMEVAAMTSQPGKNCMETVILSGNQIDEALSLLADHPHVRGMETIGTRDGAVQVRLHLGACRIADTVPLMGVAPRMPFRTRDGRDLWFLVGPQAALEEACQRLRDDGITVEIVRYADWPGIEGRLTDNQRRVLHAAVEAGYYEYPRKITLSALAARIGVAKSTLSESLMVIEKKVMTQYSDETTVRDEGEQEAADRPPPC